jgi:hypothetical protein
MIFLVLDFILLRRLFEPSWERGNVVGGWRRLGIEEFHNHVIRMLLRVFFIVCCAIRVYDVSEKLVPSGGSKNTCFILLLLPDDGSTATSRNVVCIKLTCK